ncbi:MAG: CDP-diacylglycerol--glycerol-3-phosphate 3-phosphatidyltransferase [Deltaproteobacteria bacterium]|nr:CDP-diacylglycerol--glycerol-3-phosphate 3-phosphatidyltransferase [Deltaproteobacteria bacterium]MBW2361678.1 CDP-diacylglycerol--glycerol-3-phosphate 3-phosphatidyltransferase [Deltaproteobacteria bacterium]
MAISLDEQARESSGDPHAADAVSRADAGAAPAPPERFWNLPNSVTMLRIAVVPVLLLLPLAADPASSRIIGWLFIAAAVTDIIDGWLARRGQQVTSIGKLLDPLADKLTVSTALIVMLSMGRIPGWATWMVVVIVGRELAVTGLRGVAAAGGQVMAAGGLGKAKTVSQNIAIAALIFHYTTFGLPAHQIGMVSLALATGLTLWSGYVYFANFFRGRE